MSALYGKVGESKPKILLAEPEGEIIAIPCEPGEGTIPAGRVMYRNDETGMYVEASAAEVTDDKYLVVLGQDVDISANASIAEDALAYRSGTFVRGKVTLKSDATIGRDKELILRQQGILFDTMESTETFDNQKSD